MITHCRRRPIFFIIVASIFLASETPRTAAAFQTPHMPRTTPPPERATRIATSATKPSLSSSQSVPIVESLADKLSVTAASMALAATLFLTPTTANAAFASTSTSTPTEVAQSEPTAAQITLNRLPPTSISVQIRDLPVVGRLVSGYYSKLPDTTDIKKPSLVIQSPVDKAKAIQSIVKNGHLDFDIHGLIESHLEVDISAEKAGVMNVRVASALIPKLPFKNTVASGGKESPWNMVTNMGSGEVYYYNEKTGATQYDKPQL